MYGRIGATGGKLNVFGADRAFRSPRDAKEAADLALVPKDRHAGKPSAVWASVPREHFAP